MTAPVYTVHAVLTKEGVRDPLRPMAPRQFIAWSKRVQDQPHVQDSTLDISVMARGERVAFFHLGAFSRAKIKNALMNYH